MVKQNKFFQTKTLVTAIIFGVIVSTFAAISVRAEGKKRVYSLSAVKAKFLVANKLTVELRSDLANPNINFQIRNVESYELFEDQIVMKGDGFCILTQSDDKMPVNFKTVIDANTQQASKMEYAFTDFDESSGYSPSADEDKLMTVLMNQLSKDFATQDVVVAIDNSNGVSRSNSNPAYTGNGEVKLKNGNWKKIKFEIELNPNKSAKSVVYEIK